MTNKVQQILNEAMPANRNAEWNGNRRIATILTDLYPHRDSPSAKLPEWETRVLVELKESAAAEHTPLLLVPANSWYRCTGESPHPEKRSWTNHLLKFAKHTSIPVYDGVVKVNYTAHSRIYRPREPSYFVGHIPEGAHVILYDNCMQSGATVRDMARFVESSGGKVVGIADTGSQCWTTIDEEWANAHKVGLPEVPDARNIYHGDELCSFVNRPDNTRSALLIAQVESVPKPACPANDPYTRTAQRTTRRPHRTTGT